MSFLGYSILKSPTGGGDDWRDLNTYFNADRINDWMARVDGVTDLWPRSYGSFFVKENRKYVELFVTSLAQDRVYEAIGQHGKNAALAQQFREKLKLHLQFLKDRAKELDALGLSYEQRRLIRREVLDADNCFHIAVSRDLALRKDLGNLLKRIAEHRYSPVKAWMGLTGDDVRSIALEHRAYAEEILSFNDKDRLRYLVSLHFDRAYDRLERILGDG